MMKKSIWLWALLRPWHLIDAAIELWRELHSGKSLRQIDREISRELNQLREEVREAKRT